MSNPLNERHHALYRFWDAQGALLYVGITADLPTRIKSHRDGKPWWSLVAKMTIEPYPDRPSVLAAEVTAIQTEHPLHNRQHSARSARTGVSETKRDEWLFYSLASGIERRTRLSLIWELSGDPITDNYYQDEITSYELWRMWRRNHSHDIHHIYWYIDGLDTGVFEAASFRVPARWERELTQPRPGFLGHYTWPIDPDGERLQWSRLPVQDKFWRPGRADKGGFIQELTGWKPSPLQATVDVHQLELMAGLPQVEHGPEGCCTALYGASPLRPRVAPNPFRVHPS